MTGNKIITPALNPLIAVATCPLTCTLEYWDTSKLIWVTTAVGTPSWLKAFDQTAGCTGIIDVWTKDFATYHPLTGYPNNSKWTDVQLRVTLKD